MHAVLVAAAAGQKAGPVSADAVRGQRLFETHSCNQCHSINGKGGTTAPDLGRRIGRDYEPATFAALMWNHAPKMWAAMGGQPRPLSEQEAADLFAYFYSVRYFETPADAARGKRTFESKRCGECHSGSGAVGGTPVSQWQSLGDPIEFAAAMWNHAANMRQAFAQRGVRWPPLTGQDVADIHIYVRNLPSTRRRPSQFRTAGANGAGLFESKGCVGCHTGKLALESRLGGMTLSDIAAAMWSHAPKMGTHPPALSPAEMRDLVTYLWTRQVLGTSGNAGSGQKVFSSKGCAGCHSGGGAPDLSARKGSFSSVAMVSALWQHGPRMLEQMKQKGVAWPRFTSDEMSNLIAYLNGGGRPGTSGPAGSH
jgi:mono/diheme cytochrome c family protein